MAVRGRGPWPSSLVYLVYAPLDRFLLELTTPWNCSLYNGVWKIFTCCRLYQHRRYALDFEGVQLMRSFACYFYQNASRYHSELASKLENKYSRADGALVCV